MVKSGVRESEHPSSNWLALKKKNPITTTKLKDDGRPRKRRKTEHHNKQAPSTISPPVNPDFDFSSTSIASPVDAKLAHKNGESILWLRKMILGQVEYASNQTLPGRYLAMDCEMVGVGTDGQESSLGRVSIVNYHGSIQLDEFVRQRERVVDYRTPFSGIRPADMINAKPFSEVQEQVAALLKDRILVGHAVFNDLKVLLLSHPRPQTRDTQYLAGKHKVTRSRTPALRNLVQKELEVTIQSGEHSSVTDARATMALYRLHRKEWEKGKRMPLPDATASKETGSKKRKHASVDGVDDRPHKVDEFPGGGRKGISSGLSVVTKRVERPRANDGTTGPVNAKINKTKKTTKWWKELLGDGQPKGSMNVKSR